MKKIKKRIRKDWPFLLIALTTVAIGINFLVNPNLLDDHSAYGFIVNVIDDAVFSVPILIVGVTGFALYSFGKRGMRSIFLVFYQFIWMVIFLAYLWRAITSSPNSSWVMALMINIAIFLVALWGDMDAK